jgi:probable HAF family extracellular repeat protein
VSRIATGRIRPSYLGAIGLVGLVASLTLFTSSTATGKVATACSPSMSILKSPRVGSKEVQAKALNDRGDIVGFADSNNGSGPIHAILWKGGKVAGAVDLGVLPGYVSSEAYGVNNDGVVFGLLYDKKERTFPFRWEDGRMTVLRGPNGRIQQAAVPNRNAIERGEMAGTLIIAGQRRAVRWTRDGTATFLPGLPGHAWTNAWSINGDGVVSGWSRKLPNEDGENNPVIWAKSGKAIPLKTAPGRADGAAEATNRSGLTVGYLGNLGTNKDPESDQAAVWPTRTAEPRLLGQIRPYVIAELVDVNDHGQAAGMTGTINSKNGFTLGQPVIWQTGWARLRILPVPAVSRANPVVVTELNDINARGAIVGNVFGLSGKDYSALRRIDPILWTCAFGR